MSFIRKAKLCNLIGFPSSAWEPENSMRVGEGDVGREAVGAGLKPAPTVLYPHPTNTISEIKEGSLRGGRGSHRRH